MANYSWTRYWYKSGENPRTDGFLYLMGEYESISFPFEKFAQIPCLVMLGEPGMGKSNEIKRISDNQIEDAETIKLYFNLNLFGDESRLVRKIFESDKIKEWKNGNSKLYLYLDSLDEALLNINTLSGLLADEISELPKDRLFLRVTCRSAEWSSLSKFESKLKNLWKGEDFQIIHLAKLRREDVINAVQCEGQNDEKFFKEIFEKNVVPLAAKPITLKLLLNIFKEKSEFPANQSELYERGCLALCEEDNEERPTSKKDKLTTHQRLRIAARIAAIMVFSNKSSIWTGRDTGEQTDADVSISELSGYFENDKDNIEFRLDNAAIWETIHKGLFTNNGPNRIKFEHQTYAEFLAAWYLDYRKISDEKIIEIIGKEFLHPQLYETSAWIASRRKPIFQHLMKIEPLVLLRSDVLSAEENLRAALTERLLEIFENEDARDWDSKGNYQKLKHSELAKQLRPFINDKTKGWLVRRVAIDIAEACQTTELQDDLLKVVLDETEEHPTRVNAAYAVKRIGDSATKAKLKPLIYGTYENDKNLELKGVAISALWRKKIKIEELLDVLIEPPHNFIGSYKTFFYELERNLQIDDLTTILNWLRKKIIETEYLSFEMKRLADEVMTLAWQNLDVKEIFDEYIRIILPFLKIHRQGFINSKEEITFDQQILEKRRKVLIKLLPFLNEQKDWLLLTWSPLLRFRYEDIDWLIEEWNKSDDLLIKERIMLILKDFVGSTQSYFSEGANPEFLEKICRAMDANQEFHNEICPLLEAIELNSEVAIKSKERFDEIRSWQKEEDKDLLIPSPKERVINCLNRFENGEIAWWWQMTMREMTLLPTSKYYGEEFKPCIINLPGWKEASEETRERIIKNAKEYLIKGDPDNTNWLGKNSFPFSALAGIQAIELLKIYDNNFLENLDKQVWEKWLPIIYFYPIFGSSEKSPNSRQQLIAEIYKITPYKILELLQIEIKKENQKKENQYISFDKLELCWDEKLVKMLQNSLDGYALSVPLISQILTQLFELNDEHVEKIACNLIKNSIPKREKSQELMIIGATLLIQFGKMGCWEKIWNIFNKNVEFGKRIIESGVFRFGRQGVGDLPEDQIADLYIWLSRHYLHNEDPNFSGESMAHAVGPREETGSWRNSLLEYLKHKGTPESILAIEKIMKKLPHLDWLKFTLLDARENTRLKTWQPFAPENLFKIFMNNENKVEESETTKKEISIDNLTFNGKSVSSNPYLKDLLSQYQNNPDGIVFFVGAGLSIPLFPSWTKLLNEMIDLCQSTGKIFAKDSREFKKFIKKGESFLYIASQCAKHLGDAEYYRFLKEKIGVDIDFNVIPDKYKKLIALKPKVMVTTNYDKIPEHLNNTDFHFEICHNQTISNVEHFIKQNSPFMLKLHGDINDPKTIVFTREDYDKIIYNSPEVRKSLESLLKTKTFVFLGFSFADPHIDDVFKLLQAISQNRTSPHYVLAPEMNSLKRKEKEDAFGIRIITYAHSSNEHLEVSEFIQLFHQLKSE